MGVVIIGILHVAFILRTSIVRQIWHESEDTSQKKGDARKFRPRIPYTGNYEADGTQNEGNPPSDLPQLSLTLPSHRCRSTHTPFLRNYFLIVDLDFHHTADYTPSSGNAVLPVM